MHDFHLGIQQPGSDFAVTRQFDGASPGRLRLFPGQIDLGPELRFV
jgi:hypothetical protein